MKHKRIRGFTLVEVAVVVAVIAILASLSVMAFNQVQKQSRDGKRKADITALQTLFEKYYQTNGKYPRSVYPTGSAGDILLTWTTPSQLEAVVGKIGDTFGDPLRTSGTPLFNIGGASPSYFYIGGIDGPASGNQDWGGSFSFSNSGTGFTCNYGFTLNVGETTSYILGYYNEASGKMVFVRGASGKQITWPSSAESRCNTS